MNTVTMQTNAKQFKNPRRWPFRMDNDSKENEPEKMKRMETLPSIHGPIAFWYYMPLSLLFYLSLGTVVRICVDNVQLNTPPTYSLFIRPMTMDWKI